MQPQQVSVIGLGYIGLPTAAVIASRGIKVCGVDVSSKTVDTINQGDVHIVEPDLDIVVRGAVMTETLRATLTPEPSDVFIVAVPTPFTGDRQPDLSYIQSAARAIAPVLAEGRPHHPRVHLPGRRDREAVPVDRRRPPRPPASPTSTARSAHLAVAHCPERVLPGHVLQELVANDRDHRRHHARAAPSGPATSTASSSRGSASSPPPARPRWPSSPRTPSATSTSPSPTSSPSSATTATSTSGSSSSSPTCTRASTSSAPGPGVGGHCIAVDPWFIVSSNPEKARLIRTARAVNDSKPVFVVEKVVEAAAKPFKAAGHRLPRPGLQGQHRRPPREPRPGDQPASSRRRGARRGARRRTEHHRPPRSRAPRPASS